MEKISTDRLIAIRKKHGFSQKYVAISVGVAPSIVSRWESGITTPSRENLSKLADLFNVTVDYLLSRSDEELPVSSEALSVEERKLIQDYRALNQQGQEYIRQTMYMARTIYKKYSELPNMESKIGN